MYAESARVDDMRGSMINHVTGRVVNDKSLCNNHDNNRYH